MNANIKFIAAENSNSPDETDTIVNQFAAGLGLISVICSIYLIYITSTKYAKTITVKLIQMIAVYTTIEQILLVILQTGILSPTNEIFLSAELAYSSVNSLAIFWSFTISFLSYKIITTSGQYSINKFYVMCQVISFLILAYYTIMITYADLNINHGDKIYYLIAFSFIPNHLLIPISSIILYIMQMIYAKRFSTALSSYQINIKRLVLYPVFEAIIFSSSIIKIIWALIKVPLPFSYPFEIMQGIPGIGQLIIFFFVRNIATQENLVEKEPVNTSSIEFDNISKEINVDRDLARALVDV